ncbi:hypothetical protein [Actinokineospora diospyrosa]|uniref:Uncharacterized protein n=1 Tax=Actinokineospora diospyrosa TaxID=103728 RepID=A0ABT1IE35_9PSEU|nr:hypothetical protein [Actinokineospora diospyrosa]MCP2270884.1 hypothetical protein [Actinokineospora diospyrosa]
MTLEISRDPWSTLDDLMGIEVTDLVDDGIGDLGFYGRCSTEGNQDPETSHGWQHGNANKFIGPLGGRIVADFFDIGQSRSVPWERRKEGAGCWPHSRTLPAPGPGSWSARALGAGSAISSP